MLFIALIVLALAFAAGAEALRARQFTQGEENSAVLGSAASFGLFAAAGLALIVALVLLVVI